MDVAKTDQACQRLPAARQPRQSDSLFVSQNDGGAIRIVASSTVLK